MAKKKTMGMVHAAVFIYDTVRKFTDEILSDVHIYHICDDTLHGEFSEKGYVTPGVVRRFCKHVISLEEVGCQLVILTCSTMNKAAIYARPLVNIPVLRIDEPMVRKAVQLGKRIGVYGTLKTTMPSSTELVQDMAKEVGKEIEIKQMLNERAFEEWLKGNRDRHDELVLTDLEKFSKEVDVIVLAQVSMAPLEDKVKKLPIPVLTSGRLGCEAVKKLLESL